MHILQKTLLTLALLASIATMAMAAEVTPDAVPISPGPGKITSTGTFKVDKGQTGANVRMIASPTGGGGGIGSFAIATKTTATNYVGTIEGLQPMTEYDVTIYFEYLEAGLLKAAYSKTYNVKTK